MFDHQRVKSTLLFVNLLLRADGSLNPTKGRVVITSEATAGRGSAIKRTKQST